MTPEQLFRDPQLEHVIVNFRQTERGVVHKINLVFTGTEIRLQDAAQLGALIQTRVDKAKQDLATVVARSIP